MRFTVVSLLGCAAACHAGGSEFAYETARLTPQDIGNFVDIGPAPTAPVTATPAPKGKCRAFPGTADWPLDADWKRLNASLAGALLKPLPPGEVCYPGPDYNAAKCTSQVGSQVVAPALFDDPLGFSTKWPTGDPCPVTANPTGNCTQGGYVAYVVNATSVKQVQIAVNFARNRNLRLVIKNTGHDFVGRSTGAGALAVWTHYLKGFEVIPAFAVGNYSGGAAHAGVGLEAYEVHGLMAQNGVTLVAPSFATVGAFGGFTAAGGHSSLVSYHGLASDQVLSLNVVTAGGAWVTASPTVNSDLFFALRGGGGSTYGVVTSVIVKTHPPVNTTSLSIAFSSLDVGIDLFWKAIAVYFAFGRTIVDTGGIDRTYVSPLINVTVFNFTSQFVFPGLTPQAVSALLTPLDLALRAAGVTVTFGQPTTRPWSDEILGSGSPIRDERFASRLIPRAVWDDPTKYASAMAALRTVVEGGYQVHGTHMSPSARIAGYPGADSGVNPAFRAAVMHCVVYDSAPSLGAPAATDLPARARLSRYTDYLRAATPGSGSYMNEADVLEPNFQQSFFGANYARLVGIKEKWDPWGLFWAPATVGSEHWAVRTADGEPTQNGKLCSTL